MSESVMPAPFRPRAALVLVALAMSALDGCAVDNQSACERWVDAYNEAHVQCELDARLAASEECPESMNSGRDCIAYYDALAASTQCESGEVSWDASGECER